MRERWGGLIIGEERACEADFFCRPAVLLDRWKQQIHSCSFEVNQLIYLVGFRCQGCCASCGLDTFEAILT